MRNLRDMAVLRYLLICLTLCLLPATICAEQATAVLVTVKGYFGPDQVAAITKQIDKAELGPKMPLLMVLDSTSGDLKATLGLAQHLYEQRLSKAFPIITYLSSRVLGPAALLPFVSDEVIASPYIAWGAIPQGAESIVALNVLRNQVTSLISPQHPKSRILQVLAQAMVDDTIYVIDDNGWKVVQELPMPVGTLISSKGETLVVSHLQLKELGVVTQFETLAELTAQYHLTPEEPTVVKTAEQISASAFESQLTEHIHIDSTRPLTVGHIVIDDRTSGINQGTWLLVKTALDHYKKTKPAFIILELNTPGGEVYAAELISEALKNMDVESNIPVVTYINNWAMSAGALLAYSTRFITIAKDASMGAAAPVIANAEGKMEDASEKVNSAMRSDMANRASFFGRNSLLAEAMVDKDVILVMRHGKILKLDREDQIQKTGEDPDFIISAKGKLLTLNASDLIKYGVADIVVPPMSLPEITNSEEDDGQWPANKMALFHLPFFDKMKDATIDSFRPDWRVQFLSFLTTPAVASLLMLGLMLGLYMEMSSPGVGLPGIVAVTCLFLIMLSSFALEAINSLDLIILAIGLLLLGLEVFVLPTFGFAGLIGLAMVIFGLFSLLLPSISTVTFDFDTHTWNPAGDEFMTRLVWLCGSLVVAIVVAALLGRFVVPRFAAASRLVLKGEQVGYIAGIDPKSLPQPGAEGFVAATLRPSGKVTINEVLYDAVSDGSFIEKGTPIRVLRLDGSKIVVSEIMEDIEA